MLLNHCYIMNDITKQRGRFERKSRSRINFIKHIIINFTPYCIHTYKNLFPMKMLMREHWSKVNLNLKNKTTLSRHLYDQSEPNFSIMEEILYVPITSQKHLGLWHKRYKNQIVFVKTINPSRSTRSKNDVIKFHRVRVI